MRPQDKQAIIATINQLPELQATFIKTSSIAVAEWVRYKCQYSCDHYNQTLCCPPFTPTPEATRRILADYKAGLILTISNLDKVSSYVVEIEKALFQMNYYKALGFGLGFCTLCKSCNLEHCTHPKLARPSMEACGIDVMKTLENNGISIKFPIQAGANYSSYGLVLIQ